MAEGTRKFEQDGSTAAEPFDSEFRDVIRIGSACLLGLLVLVFIVFDLAAAIVMKPSEDGHLGLILGVAFAQATMLAVWGAWGPARAVTRVPTSLVLMGVVTLCVWLCFGGNRGDTERVVALIVAGQFILLQVPLWISRVLGWRLRWPWEQLAPLGNEESRYGIRQLLAWTAIVAVFLAIGRGLLSNSEALRDLMGDMVDNVMIVVLLMAYNALLCLPIVWACFVRRWMVAWLAVAVVCSVLITVAEVLNYAVLRRAPTTSDIIVFALMNTTQFFITLGCLLLVRGCGFRVAAGR